MRTEGGRSNGCKLLAADERLMRDIKPLDALLLHRTAIFGFVLDWEVVEELLLQSNIFPESLVCLDGSSFVPLFSAARLYMG